jgi:putative RecB family exonuclease
LSQLPEYLSASSITTFEQCPLKYKLSRVDQIKEPPTRETLLGNFVHEVMEIFYAIESNIPRDITTVRVISSDVWESGDWKHTVAPHLRGMSLQQFRWNAWWCIENVFKLEDPNLINVKGIELELNAEIEGIPIKGFIDRLATIDGRDTISDYKTGKTPRPAFMKDKYFQPLLYFICLSQGKQLIDPVVELLYLKDGERRQLEPTPELCAETIETVVNVNSKIQAAFKEEYWEAIPSKLCDWCFFKYNGCTHYVKDIRRRQA